MSDDQKKLSKTETGSGISDKPLKLPKLETDKVLYLTPIVLIMALCLYLGLNLEKANELINITFAFITGDFSWFYQMFTFGCLAICLYMIFGKYGTLKFGDEKPEFSTFSWLSMIFTAGLGGSVVLWATIEPFYYLIGPPFGVKPYSYEAFQWATAYPLFHWGFPATPCTAPWAWPLPICSGSERPKSTGPAAPAPCSSVRRSPRAGWAKSSMCC